MIKQYRNYLKDNPHGYWFKAKLYGWGWTPATWQGWLTLAVFGGFIVLNYYRLQGTEMSAGDIPYAFLTQTTGMVIVLILVCYTTGEKPRWQWGLKDHDE